MGEGVDMGQSRVSTAMRSDLEGAGAWRQEKRQGDGASPEWGEGQGQGAWMRGAEERSRVVKTRAGARGLGRLWLQ